MYHNSFLTVFYPHIVNFRNFAGCEMGYYDYNCTATCRYPSFGYRCQRKCNCIRDKCDLKFSKYVKKQIYKPIVKCTCIIV